MTVPGVLLPYTRVLDGLSTAPRMQLRNDERIEQHLRFQLPAAALPMQVERARLTVRIDAPARRVTVSGQDGQAFTAVQEVESPLDPIRVEIDQPGFLTLDDRAGCTSGLTVSGLSRTRRTATPARTTGPSVTSNSKSPAALWRSRDSCPLASASGRERAAAAHGTLALARQWFLHEVSHGAAQPVVETENLTKKYGKFVALDRLTLSVERGQILGFIGPNGAGKTTTIKILVGLARPTSGTATVAGVDCVAEAAEAQAAGRLHARHVRLLRQHAGRRVPRLLRGGVRHPAQRARPSGSTRCWRLAGAGTFNDLYVESLSHGMKQRVAIARTLLHDPEVLILDEPANGLDPQARIEMRQLLLDLAERGKTLLVTSHILPELARICHRVAIITRGRLRAFGTLDEITRQLSPLRPMEVLLTRAEQLDRAVEVVRRHVEPGAEVTAVAGRGGRPVPHRAARGGAGRRCWPTWSRPGVGVAQFREVQTDLEEAFMTVPSTRTSRTTAPRRRRARQSRRRRHEPDHPPRAARRCSAPARRVAAPGRPGRWPAPCSCWSAGRPARRPT